MISDREHNYRSVVDNAIVAIFVAQDEKVQFSNPQASKLTGYSEEELSLMPILNIIYPEDLQRIAEEVKLNTEKHIDQFSQTYRILCSNGEIRCSSISVAIIAWKVRFSKGKRTFSPVCK